MIRIAPCWLFIASALAAPAAAQDAPADRPAARSDVIDSAKIFPAEAVTRAKARLAEIEHASSVPVVIETVESLRGEPIEEAALQAARNSGGHGLFVFIAKDERKIAKPLVRRQFEHRVSEDRKAAIRDAFLEGFKAGDFGDGLRRGVDAIASTLHGPADRAPVPAPAQAPSSSWGMPSAGSASIVRDQPRLTLVGARKALAAAEAKAIEMKLSENLAVVDDGGHLMAFVRMDGARPASAATAQTKAASAATFRKETGPNPGVSDPTLNLGLALAAAASGARITPLLGGIPILVDGQVVGAIGAAGGTGEQDAEVARAGVAALAEDLKKPAEKESLRP